MVLEKISLFVVSKTSKPTKIRMLINGPLSVQLDVHYCTLKRIQKNYHIEAKCAMQ